MDAKKEKMSVEITEDEVFEEDGAALDAIENVDEDERAARADRAEKLRQLMSVSKKIFVGVLYVLGAYIIGLGELFFGAKPLGVALLCAATGKIGYIYAGLCLSAATGGEGAVISLCAYTILLLVRILSRITIDVVKYEGSENEYPSTWAEVYHSLFSEHISLRMATACLGAFMIGIYNLAAGGFLFYDLYGTVIGMALAPAAVYLYYGYLGSVGLSEKRRFAAICALAASLCFCARELTLGGMSLSLFGAMIFTLYLCRRRGTVYGLVAGSVCGLAYSPMLAPLFAFGALTSGALWGVSVFFVAFSAATVGIAWGLYAQGISALTSVLPAILAASLLYAVVDRLYIGEHIEKEEKQKRDELILSEQRRASCVPLGADAIDKVLLDDSEQRIKVMCETFSSLSSLFYSLSEKMRLPSSADLKQICDNAFDASCQGCEMRATCWEKEYANSLAAVSSICATLGQKGHIGRDDIAPRLYERCSAMPDIIDQINHNSMLHLQQLIIGDKTEIFALDYEAVSELLASCAIATREEFEYNEKMSVDAAELLCHLGFSVDSVLSYGSGRDLTFVVRAKDPSSIFSRKDDITAALEGLCGEKLECNIKENVDSGADAIISRARKFKIEYAKRSVKAEGENGFCGDTVNIFENGRDHFYSFISDGMGSGRDAALTSGICSVFLSKILTATGKCELSLDMLNGFLRNKGSGSMHECSATVDLMDLDLIGGSASFFKGGAAPSYIFREDNLFKLRSSTIPLGIIKELDTKKITMELSVGDVIIMVSDGVTQSREECPWLYELLKANVGKESLTSLSDMIIKRAKYEGADDDISVIVMRVEPYFSFAKEK